MEMRDVVDEEDNILGQMTKKESRKKGMIARAVLVFVFNDGKVLIQQRSENKGVAPGKWEFPVGGVQGGESYDDGVRRELQEELFNEEELPEITLEKLFKTYVEVDSLKRFVTAYKTNYEGKFSPNPLEVAATRWITLPELVKEVEENREQFSEGLHVILHEFLKYGA